MRHQLVASQMFLLLPCMYLRIQPTVLPAYLEGLGLLAWLVQAPAPLAGVAGRSCSWSACSHGCCSISAAVARLAGSKLSMGSRKSRRASACTRRHPGKYVEELTCLALALQFAVLATSYQTNRGTAL